VVSYYNNAAYNKIGLSKHFFYIFLVKNENSCCVKLIELKMSSIWLKLIFKLLMWRLHKDDQL